MFSSFVVWLAIGSVGYGTLDERGFMVDVRVVVIFWARARLIRFWLLKFCWRVVTCVCC